MEQETKIRKILFNEVSLTVAIIAAVMGAVSWVSNPQQELTIQITKLQSQVESNELVSTELAKIKNNDLHEMQLRMDRIEARQVEELQAIARIEALLGKNR
jgi:uncharacterized membrane protein